MDVQLTKQEIEGFLARIGDPQQRATLQARLDEILGRHAIETDPAIKRTIEAELSTLRSEAESAATTSPQAPAGGNGGGASESGGDGLGGAGHAAAFLTLGGFILVIIVTVFSFVFLFFYFWMLGGENFTSVESIRPLLVLTLIISMLGFGGLLIVRALFAPYDGDELQNRFRLGREIFLVFSGIFGTIIGFYFGSEDDEDAVRALSLNVAIASPRTLTVEVTGGDGPYRGILTIEGASGDLYARAQEPLLRFADIPATACPRSADIIVVDGRGRLAETEVPQSNAELNAAGWTACPAEAGEETNNSSTANESAGNTANETSPTGT